MKWLSQSCNILLPWFILLYIAGCSLLVSLLRFTTNERIARDGELKGAFIHP